MPASTRMPHDEPKETFAFKFPPEAAEDYARMRAEDPYWPAEAPPARDFLALKRAMRDIGPLTGS